MDKQLLKKANHADAVCCVRESVVSKGKAKGVTLIDADNGRLHFTVTIDNGADIYSLRHRGDNIGFISKNGMCGEHSESEFANVFPGGFLYTCGLDAIGVQPGKQMHGRFHYLKPDNYSYSCADAKIEITAQFSDTALFGQNLRLKRVITTEYMSETLTVCDTVENAEFTDAEYIALYHFNLGYPMLDSSAEICADFVSTEPYNDEAKLHLGKERIMEEPIDGAEEQVFCHTLGKGEITVKNEKLKKKVSFLYDNSILPTFTEWKSLKSGDYALGIEPAVSSFIGERKYRKLAAGAKDEIKFVINVSDI